jgi:hypothetical protein
MNTFYGSGKYSRCPSFLSLLQMRIPNLCSLSVARPLETLDLYDSQVNPDGSAYDGGPLKDVTTSAANAGPQGLQA